MRRVLLAAVLVTAALTAGCSDDAPEEKTIAFLRAVAYSDGSQEAFLEELESAGWEVGENLTLLSSDPNEAYPEEEAARDAARGFVEDGADLIVALASSSALAAREVAGDVPILFLVNDPVAAGIVTDERAPDGNLTGTSFRVPADRTLDVLRSLGDIDSVAIVGPANDPAAESVREDLLRASRQLDLRAIEATFADETDAGEAVRTAAADGAEAIALVSSPTTVRAFDAIEAAATEANLPVIANTTVAEFAMVILSPDPEAVYRQMGRQAARLLDGSPVRDVPVEDPAGFVMTVRRDIAERVGIELPEDLLARADEVVG